MTKPKYYELCFPDSPIKVRVFKSYGGKTYELYYDCKWHCFQPMSMKVLKEQTHDMIARAIFEIDEEKVNDYKEKVKRYVETFNMMRELTDDSY